MFQSFNYRSKTKLKPFYHLVAAITAEELSHVELVGRQWCGPVPVLFRSGAHVRRPSIRRPQVIFSPVFSTRIIKAVDVFEEGDLDVAPGVPVAAPDAFSLQGLEEAFDGGVIITIALAAHRDPEPVLAQNLLVIMGTILRPATRVVNAARRVVPREVV